MVSKSLPSAENNSADPEKIRQALAALRIGCPVPVSAPDCVDLAQRFLAVDLILPQTMKRPFARPSLTLFSALCDLRAPLVALAVIAFQFQAMLPLAAASGSPQPVAALSICFGAAEDNNDSAPGHSGTCLCGSTCPHAGCSGCFGPSGRDMARTDPPQIGAWPNGTSILRGHSRRATAQSRAPPIYS